MEDVVGLVSVSRYLLFGRWPFHPRHCGPTDLCVPWFCYGGPFCLLLDRKRRNLVLNRYGEANPSAKMKKLLLQKHTAFVLHTVRWMGLVAGAAYAGRPNLCAAYIAGACLGWWDSELPHPGVRRTTVKTEQVKWEEARHQCI